jgi:hypothetical protein
VKAAGVMAANDSKVGGFESFLRQAMRFIPVTAASRCRHDRVAVGVMCPGCQNVVKSPLEGPTTGRKAGQGVERPEPDSTSQKGAKAQKEHVEPRGGWRAVFKASVSYMASGMKPEEAHARALADLTARPKASAKR